MTVPKITDYDLYEKLGSGSYATVYKARHKKTKQFHAIKCVQKSSLSRNATDNLVNEIQLLKSLTHKYIVSLDDFFWDDKNIYIVLEYCNAGNLSSFIRQNRVLSESTCRYFIRQLALAIRYMRTNKVCHFDLKPQNLLLTRNPNVVLKIADFGFAQHLNFGEKNYSLKGSPLYMAPEIVLKQIYDERADLWSIGVILFECLFGSAPYSSRSVDELIKKIKRQEKIQIPSNSKISSDCKDLLTRLLQHDPSKRISFKEFFDHPFLDLEHFPSEESLQKAIAIVTTAVEKDQKEQYEEAYYLYCKALQFFVPFITEEVDATKRQALRHRVLTYLKRAEEIKNGVQQFHENLLATQVRPSLSSILEPTLPFKQVYALAASSPSMQSALEVGRQGELYSYEKSLDNALECFRSALGVLVPMLNKEPKGERRNLLHKQIIKWMKEAESIKSILLARNMEEENLTIYNCSLQ